MDTACFRAPFEQFFTQTFPKHRVRGLAPVPRPSWPPRTPLSMPLSLADGSRDATSAMSWAQQAAAGRFCDAAEPAADEPGDGTLYDTAKFWGEEQRIKALEALGMLDTSREQFFDKASMELTEARESSWKGLKEVWPGGFEARFSLERLKHA